MCKRKDKMDIDGEEEGGKRSKQASHNGLIKVAKVGANNNENLKLKLPKGLATLGQRVLSVIGVEETGRTLCFFSWIR